MKAIFLIGILACGTFAQKLPAKFPADYRGDSFLAVQRLLWPYDQLAKSEFETMTEFAARKEALLTQTKINGHPLKNTIFIITPYCTYDADKKEFYCISLKPDERVDSADSTRWYKLQLSLPTTEVPFTQWNWPIDVATAREVKAFLKVAVVGAPVMVGDSTIIFIPTQAVMFNQKTGEIYKQLEIGTVAK